MSNFINLTGQRFARLLVIKRENKDKNGGWKWLCLCDCGRQTIIRVCSLRSGHTKSCGCLNKEIITKHGHNRDGKASRTKTHRTWDCMIQRCTNPKNNRYDHYGGRGITVCDRWSKFENFIEDMGEVPEGHQIDRIDNNGNYCKSNCRWANRRQQARNKRNNHLLTYDGKTQCLTAWAEEFNISKLTLSSRIKSGWSIEKAITVPVGKDRK